MRKPVKKLHQPEEQEKLDAHLSECPDCRTMWEQDWKGSSTLPKNLVKKLAFCRFCVKYTRINTKKWHCAYCYFKTDILEYKQEERAGVLRVP